VEEKLHRFLMDTYLKLHRMLYWYCCHCDETVQQYLMNGTRVDQCGMCGASKPGASSDSGLIRELFARCEHGCPEICETQAGWCERCRAAAALTRERS